MQFCELSRSIASLNSDQVQQSTSACSTCSCMKRKNENMKQNVVYIYICNILGLKYLVPIRYVVLSSLCENVYESKNQRGTQTLQMMIFVYVYVVFKCVDSFLFVGLFVFCFYTLVSVHFVSV